jgi:aryl-alcohol dehydrogenase-like predicted oxidoreductase
VHDVRARAGRGGSREIISRFLEAGGDFIDTADVYE